MSIPLVESERINSLEQRVKELEVRSQSSFCMYCGEVFTCKDTSEESIKSVYEAALSHDGACAKNPIVKERDSIKEQLVRAEKFARKIFGVGTFDNKPYPKGLFEKEWQREVVEGGKS